MARALVPSRCDGLGGILAAHTEHATPTSNPPPTFPTAHMSKAAVCLALAGADAAMRTVISPSVAVATPTRGKSRRRLRACARAFALTPVTEA